MSIPIRKRIMIADDHDIVLNGLRALIERAGEWEIVGEAKNGRAALSLALETKPDICILDYSLPQMNGLTLTREIRRRLPRTEILIFTMHENDEVVRGLLHAGARSFILKSDTEEHLLAALDALSHHNTYFTSSVSETLLNRFLSDDPADPSQSILTDRELEIVQMIAEGRMNKQVSNDLGISVKTVESHRASVMRKLNLTTAADLVRYAVRHNIIEP